MKLVFYVFNFLKTVFVFIIIKIECTDTSGIKQISKELVKLKHK